MTSSPLMSMPPDGHSRNVPASSDELPPSTQQLHRRAAPPSAHRHRNRHALHWIYTAREESKEHALLEQLIAEFPPVGGFDAFMRYLAR